MTFQQLAAEARRTVANAKVPGGGVLDDGSMGTPANPGERSPERKRRDCDICSKPIPFGRRSKCSQECMEEANRRRAGTASKANYTPRNWTPIQCDICTAEFVPALAWEIICPAPVCSKARKRKSKIIAERKLAELSKSNDLQRSLGRR